MSAAWDRNELSDYRRVYPDDLVIDERPARPRRITPEVVAQELAARFNRPVVEFDGLIVNHEINDIERYARVMGWDES